MGILEGKVAVVTGANSGVGRCTAMQLCREGASVVGIARREDALLKVKEEIEKDGGRFEAYAGDITLEENADAVIAYAVKTFGKIDILVNAAGMLDYQYPCGAMESERWDNVVALNLTAPMMTSRKAITHMLEQGNGGNIINVGSTATLNGCVGGAAYTATKELFLN